MLPLTKFILTYLLDWFVRIITLNIAFVNRKKKFWRFCLLWLDIAGPLCTQLIKFDRYTNWMEPLYSTSRIYFRPGNSRIVLDNTC